MFYRQVLDADGKYVGFIDADGYFHSYGQQNKESEHQGTAIYKISCTVLGLACCLLLLWIFADHRRGSAEIQIQRGPQEISGGAVAIRTDESKLIEKLKKRAHALNKNLPFLMNNGLVLRVVTVEPAPLNQMTFHYQVVSRASKDIDKEGFYQSMRLLSANWACDNPELVPLLQRGITICFSYWGSDNGLISDIKVTGSECKINS